MSTLKINVYEAATGGNPIKTVEAEPGTGAPVTGLKGDTNYWVTAYKVGAGDHTDSSETKRVATKTCKKLPVPAAPTVEAITKDGGTVKFVEVAGGTHYTVNVYDKVTGGTRHQFGSAVAAGTAVTGLAAKTDYWASVFASPSVALDDPCGSESPRTKFTTLAS